MTKNNQQLRHILIIEPFYGGSHKQFIDTIYRLSVDYDSVVDKTGSDRSSTISSKNSIITTAAHSSQSRTSSKWPLFNFKFYGMSGKKWHWRARTSALYLSRVILENADKKFDILFASSVLNLAELIALRPDIGRIPIKIIYFHENQLEYPLQHHKERDFQYGYNEILSCLTATQLVFNSNYNRNSFIGGIRTFLKMMPDYPVPDLEDMINSLKNKSMVIYFPIKFDTIPLMHAHRREKRILHIIWPHRWEHDKNPEIFFDVLFKLKERKINFKVSVLGESYSIVPKIFEEAKARLSEEIVHFGYIESKQDYYDVLTSGNVCISTAIHEFFGVSMLEAAYCGCYPLCPSRLVYPEIFPGHYLYQTVDELLMKLEEFGRSPESIPLPLDIAYDAFDWVYCQDEYKALLSKSTTQSLPSSPSTSQQSPTKLSSLTSKLKSVTIGNNK